MGTTDFLLNCFVLGDKDNLFTVKIPKTDNVILKDMIKEKKAPHFNHIAASDLDLWTVCLPIDDLASKKPQTGPPLRGCLRCGMVTLRMMIYTSW